MSRQTQHSSHSVDNPLKVIELDSVVIVLCGMNEETNAGVTFTSCDLAYIRGVHYCKGLHSK